MFSSHCWWTPGCPALPRTKASFLPLMCPDPIIYCDLTIILLPQHSEAPLCVCVCVCVCAPARTDGAGWTLTLSIWSPRQYNRCMEQRAAVLLSLSQVFRDITEPAPPVSSRVRCLLVFITPAGEKLSESRELLFYNLSLFMRLQPQSTVTPKILLRELNPGRLFYRKSLELQCLTLYIWRKHLTPAIRLHLRNADKGI